MLLLLLFALLNLFSLDPDPKVSATYMPDNLVGKIAGEIAEVLAFVVQVLAPHLDAEMDARGITRHNRSNRGGLLRDGRFTKLPHPLILFALHSEPNFSYVMSYGAAYIREKNRRYPLSAKNPPNPLPIYEFLEENVDRIAFSGKRWEDAVKTACGMVYLPTNKSRSKRLEDLARREEYSRRFRIHFDSPQGHSVKWEGFADGVVPEGTTVYKRYLNYLIKDRGYALKFTTSDPPSIYPDHRVWDKGKRDAAKRSGIPLREAERRCVPDKFRRPSTKSSAGTK